MSRWLLLLVPLGLALLLLCTVKAPRAAPADDELQAGFAEADITPRV